MLNRELGRQVMNMRLDAGLTKSELARRMGCSINRLTKIENGECCIWMVRRIGCAIREEPLPEALQETDMGKRMREAREKNHLTQTELGLLVGTNGATVNRWENGRPPIRKAYEVMSVLETYDPSKPLPGEEIGKRLTEARNARSMSMSQVADMLGVTVDTVFHWEKGAISEERAQEVISAIQDSQAVCKEHTRFLERVEELKAYLEAHEGAYPPVRSSLGIWCTRQRQRRADMNRMQYMILNEMNFAWEGVRARKKDEACLKGKEEEGKGNTQDAPGRDSDHEPCDSEGSHQRPQPDHDDQERPFHPLPAERIRQARSAAHMTQGQVAELMGLSQSRISSMEHGDVQYAMAMQVIEAIREADKDRM